MTTYTVEVIETLTRVVVAVVDAASEEEARLIAEEGVDTDERVLPLSEEIQARQVWRIDPCCRPCPGGLYYPGTQPKP